MQFNPTDLGGDTFARATVLDPLVAGAFSLSDFVGASDVPDFYRFTLTTAQAIDLSLSGLGAAVHLELYSADGVLLSDVVGGDAGAARITGSLAAGTFYIGVGSDTGLVDTPYTLTLAQPPSQDGPAAHAPIGATSLGALSTTVTTVTDRADAAFGPDVYTFTLAAAATVNLRLGGLAFESQVGLVITDGAGNVVAAPIASEGAEGLVRRQLAAGTYFVSVAPYNGVGTSYSLSAWTGSPTVGTAGAADGAGNSIASAKSLGTLGAKVTVADYVSDSGDVSDFYKFVLAATSRVNFFATGLKTGTSTYINIRNAAGDTVWSGSANDNGGSLVGILTAGTYYAEMAAGGGATGYSLQASAVAVPNAVGRTRAAATALGPLSSTAISKSDWVGVGAPDDFYSFTLAGNSRVSLRLTVPNGGGTAFLTLTNSAGTVVGTAEWRDNGYWYYTGGTGNTLRQESPFEGVLGAGTYYVQVHTDDIDKAYTLTASAVAGPDGTAGKTLATAAALGTLGATPVSKTDWVGDSAPIDMYSFKLAAYSLVSLKLSGIGAAVMPTFDILDASGNVIVEDYEFGSTGDESGTNVRLAAGTYYVRINNAANDRSDDGAYTLTASAVAGPNGSGGKSLSAAASLPGGIGASVATLADFVGGAAGGADWFKFTLAGTQTVNFLPRLSDYVNATGGTFYLTLYDASGNTIAWNSVSSESAAQVLTVVDLAAGTYYLDIGTDANGAPYRLSYWTGAPAVGTSAVDGAGPDVIAPKDLGILSATAATATDWVGKQGSVSDPRDFYSFTVASRSNIAIALAAVDGGTGGNSYTGTLVLYGAGYQVLRTVQFVTDGKTFTLDGDLGAGVYYVRITPDDATYSIGYSLSASVNAVIPDAVGHSLVTARDLGAIGPVAATFADVAEYGDGYQDFFKFAVGSNSVVTILLGTPGSLATRDQLTVTVFDADGYVVEARSYNAATTPAFTLNLDAGYYYLKVEASPRQSTEGVSRQSYSLSVSGTAAATTPAVSPAGSVIASADALGTLGAAPLVVSGWVGNAAWNHVYSFTTDKAGWAGASVVALDNDSGSVRITLQDASGTVLASQQGSSLDGVSAYKLLGPGTYFVTVSNYQPSTHVAYQLSVGRSVVDGPAGHTLATATVITPSTTVTTLTDGLAPGIADDVYRFTLTSQQKLNVRLLDGEGPYTNTYFTIADAFGNQMLVGADGSGAKSVTLNAGTYFLFVGSSTNDDTPYELSFWTGAVSVGSSGSDVAGSTLAKAYALGTLTTTPVARPEWVGDSDPTDLYKFILAKASTVNLAFSGLGTGAALYWTVLDASGNVLRGASTDNDPPNFDLGAGTYYLQIDTAGTNTGYRLNAAATALPDTAGKTLAAPKSLGALGATPISVSDAVYAFPGSSNKDYYSFTLASISTVKLRMSDYNLKDGAYWQVVLLDSGGSAIATNYAYSGYQTIERVLAAGTYRVEISTPGQGSVTYTLTATAATGTDGSASHSFGAASTLPALTAAPTVVASDWVGAAASTDYYKFTLTEGSEVFFELDTFGGAGYIHLLDASGSEIIADYANDRSHPGAVVASLAAGTYTIKVDGDAKYELIARATPSPDGSAGHDVETAKVLSPTTSRQSVSDWVGGSAPQDYYKITLAADATLTLNLATDVERGLTVSLLDENLNTFVSTGYYPGSPSTGISYALGAGTYFVRVNADPSYDSRSTYTLTYATGALPVGTKAAADGAGNSFAAAKDLGTVTSLVRATDWVGSTDAVDYYKFTLSGYSLARFGVNAAYGGNYRAVLYDASGNAVGTIGDEASYGTEKLYRWYLEGGTYYVGVTTADAAGQGYSLSLEASAEARGPGADFVTATDLGVNPGATSTAGGSGYQQNRYVHFALTSQTLVDFDLVMQVGAASARLLDGNHELVADGTFDATTASNGRYRAMLSAGDYYVEVKGLSGDFDRYTLGVTPNAIAVSAPTLVEGNAGTASLVFTVTLSTVSSLPVTVNYTTADGSAGVGDYAPTTGTLTIAAGQLSGTISIPVTGDTLYEADETVKLTLSNANGATFAGGAASQTATGTIKNDDAPPVATLSSAMIVEGNAGTTTLVFTVTLSAASGMPTTFSYSTSDGTASAGSDYAAASGTLTIAAGETSGTVSITVNGDTLYEAGETLTLTLANPSGASFAGGAPTLSATGTIANDDAPPVASIASAVVTEGNSGTANLVFTVTLSNASVLPVTIAYAAANGTALAGSDYTATSGTLTIAAGQTSGTISIPVLGDTTYEANETLTLTLSNPAGASFAGGATSLSATGTITNDDAKPVATLTASTVTEGNSGTKLLAFTIKLSAASSQATTFSIATANGTAIAGSDYVARTGTVTIAAGQTSAVVNVTVNGDTLYEANETVKLTLSSPSGATFAGGVGSISASGTLTNDDTAPVATVSGATLVEGNDGTTTLVFTVTLSAASGLPATFSYATSNGTALAGSDYVASTGTLTIAAGQTSGTVSITVNGDTLYEANETLTLTLSNASGASFVGGAASLAATGTIGNDDAPPVASLSGAVVVEGNDGTTSLVYTVTLSAISGLATTIAYATADGTATAGSDYVATSGTLTIAAGQTTGTITVLVNGDAAYEADETVTLGLSSPSGASFAGGAPTLAATGTIANDDAPPVASIASAVVTEGNSGTANLVFTVTLSNASVLPVTIAYAAANGTALAGSDYTAASGTLTIAAGQTSGTITIPVLGDTTYEANETLTLTLSNPSGATFAGGAASLSATGTITNDDAKPVATLTASTVTEGNSGTKLLAFTIKLSAASSQASTFSIATANGTAISGSDYVARTGTITIAAGQTSTVVNVTVNGDTLYEASETVKLTLSNANGFTFAGGTTTLAALGTISNDDTMPVASIGAVQVVEGNSGTTNLVFTISLSAASGLATTIDYATADGTATAGSDYVAKSGTLTIAAGQTSATVSIAVNGDTLYEANETLKLTLSNPSRATFAGGGATLSATGTVTNDDVLPLPVPTVSAAPLTLSVGGAAAALSSAVTVGIASGDVIQSYELLDTNTAANSATISVNGVSQAAGTPLKLTASQYALATITPGTVGGADTVFVRVTGKGGVSGWTPLGVGTVAAGSPVVTATDKTVSANTSLAAGTLATVDLAPQNVAAYEFIDMTADPASGSFKVGGVTQSAGAVIDVLSSQLAATTFLSGGAGTSDEIWVRASNGTNWSNWGRLTVAAGSLAA